SLPTSSKDGVVAGDVYVRGFRIERVNVKVRDTIEIGRLAACGNGDIAKARRFFARQRGKITGLHISSLMCGFQAKQVQRYGGELHLRTSVDIKNLVIVGQAGKLPEQF